MKTEPIIFVNSTLANLSVFLLLVNSKSLYFIGFAVGFLVKNNPPVIPNV